MSFSTEYGIFTCFIRKWPTHDRDLMLQVEMDRRTSHMGELQRVFKALDSDGSGKVNFQQFSNFIQLPDVAALFSVLGLDVSDPRAFFQALDIDSSAELEEDEFVMGCMQYQGNAKATDMVFLLRDTQSVLREIRQNMQRTSEQLVRMEHVLHSGPVTNSTTTEAGKFRHPGCHRRYMMHVGHVTHERHRETWLYVVRSAHEKSSLCVLPTADDAVWCAKAVRCGPF